MLNLAVVLEDSARTVPDRDAVVLGNSRLCYAEVDAAANAVANLLVSLGIHPGDKVALSCPNLPSFPIVYYGILKAGAVVVPLNVMFKRREIGYHLSDSDAKAYLCFEGTDALPMAVEGHAGFGATATCEHFIVITTDPHADAPVADVMTLGRALRDQPTTFDSFVTEATDTAVILYTSGTTGQPKGAELTHANIFLNCYANERLFGRHPDGHDVYLATLPLFHSFGQTVVMNTGFSLGGTLVMLPRFDPRQALALMQSEGVTFFAGVPTMYWGLLGAVDDGVDVDSLAKRLRMAISGGSALPVEIISDFQRRFGVQIKEGYGLSETSPVATFNPTDRDPKPGSIGTPIWGVECQLIDPEWHEVAEPDAVGEIAIRGHNVMAGYYNRPEATQAVMRDGWFRSGDLARRDEDGYYYIVDRAKDLIIRGGLNVYPREVEEVLMSHPGVSLVAVIGTPSESLGEEVKAIVIKNPDDPTTEDQLIAWTRERMATYKCPRVVEFRDTLPMTATGKILKRELG